LPELHIAVCVKIVPKPEEIRVDPETHLLDRSNARAEINPPDMNALEVALALKDRHGGRMSVLSMGPPYFEPYLRVGLAMGADEIFLLSDRAGAAGAGGVAGYRSAHTGIRTAAGHGTGYGRRAASYPGRL
jgi:electron transfer flavoprotein beta subunit